MSAQQELASKTCVADAVALRLTFPIASNNKRLQTSVLHPQSLNAIIFEKFKEVRIVIHVKDYKREIMIYVDIRKSKFRISFTLGLTTKEAKGIQ